MLQIFIKLFFQLNALCGTLNLAFMRDLQSDILLDFHGDLLLCMLT